MMVWCLGSALQNQLENDPLLIQSQDRQLSDVVIEKVQEVPVCYTVLTSIHSFFVESGSRAEGR